jgi:protein involved in polysaccharide export with SLBB domain
MYSKASISGSVRKPGEYIYDSTLSVKDTLVMTGGIKLEAAANRVDVFRLEIDETERTRTCATSIGLNRELEPFNDRVTLALTAIVLANTFR